MSNFQGPTNDEGLEGDVIKNSVTILIPNDYTRCTNKTCPINKNCKRFLQYELDRVNSTENQFYYAEFVMLKSNLKDFSYEETCDKFIKNN